MADDNVSKRKRKSRPRVPHRPGQRYGRHGRTMGECFNEFCVEQQNRIMDKLYTPDYRTGNLETGRQAEIRQSRDKRTRAALVGSVEDSDFTYRR